MGFFLSDDIRVNWPEKPFNPILDSSLKVRINTGIVTIIGDDSPAEEETDPQ